MTDAEIPQPISSLPARWAGLTTGQLAWLAVGGLAPMAGVRLHLALAALGAVSAPWVLACAGLGFGRRRGRRLDAYLVDAALFRLQPHELLHPEAARGRGRFREVDCARAVPKTLPWAPREPEAGPW